MHDELKIPEIKFETVSDAPKITLEGGKEPLPKKEVVIKKPMLMKFKPKFNINKKWLKIGGIAGGVILAIILILAVAIGIPARGVYAKAKKLNVDQKDLTVAFKSQDMNKVKMSLAQFHQDLNDFQGSYNKLSWLKIVPVVNSYFADGDHGVKGAQYGLDTLDVVVTTIEPYADLLGFKTASNPNATATTSDRITFMIKTLNSVLPNLDKISQKANLAKAEIDQINASHYPTNIKGVNVQDKIRQIQSLVDEGTVAISQGKPLLEEAPDLLGMNGTKTYLILFQNDKELRPTGGFITAYAIMKVTNGKFEPVSSSDIYNLDGNYTPSIPAPDPIIKYIKGPYAIDPKLRLRDMNFSPDFKVSMDTFSKEAKKAGIGQVDGIVAVDTQVLVNILNVIGKIGVPGFGNYSAENDARCNCPNVIYELESFADVEGPVVWSQNEPGKIVFAPANYDNRKKIVGPLMNSILSNAMGQPKDKLPALFSAVWDSLLQKHILFYSADTKSQSAGEEFNIAGRVRDYDGDYLEINDANLGGRKSNLYVTQEVEKTATIASDGSVENVLTITYKNPQGQDGWLNSVLPSWVRIYVPKGSTLTSVEGLDAKQDPYEDLGKTVFAGLYTLRPKGVVKLTFKYKSPVKPGKEYKLLIQKQPGTNAPNYTVRVGRQKQDLQLKVDQELKFNL